MRNNTEINNERKLLYNSIGKTVTSLRFKNEWDVVIHNEHTGDISSENVTSFHMGYTYTKNGVELPENIGFDSVIGINDNNCYGQALGNYKKIIGQKIKTIEFEKNQKETYPKNNNINEERFTIITEDNNKLIITFKFPIVDMDYQKQSYIESEYE